MSVVVDASVTLDWCLDSEQSLYGMRVLEHILVKSAVVPSIWPSEVSNGLLARCRRRLLTVASLTQVATMLSRLPIEVYSGDDAASIARLVECGRVFSLTAYDASYLSLAMARGLPIATSDSALIKAAASAGVPLFESSTQHQP